MDSAFDTLMRTVAVPALETVFGVTATHITAETIGAEALAAGDWTVGAAWTQAPAGTFAHEAGTGHTATLSHAATVTAGVTYLLVWTMDWRTAGSVTVTLGGQTKAGVTGSFAWRVTATSTAGLVMTPTATFDGTLSGLSLKPISAGVSTAGVTVLQGMELLATGELGERMEERRTLELAASHQAAVGDTFVVDCTTWQATQLVADDGYLQRFAVMVL